MRPNILFIMSDDHTRQAMSCYAGHLNQTPNIDRIANEGMRMEHTFCCNALCAPSRASILSGTYSHVNGVKTLRDRFDGRQPTFPQLLQRGGYETAMFGKWHLGHGGDADPTGFDYWDVLEDQGAYFDSNMIRMGQQVRVEPGYSTDVVTDLTLQWLQSRSGESPFMAMCHYKAPHRPWIPDEAHQSLYEDIELPYPENFDDTYQGKAAACALNMNRIEWLGEKDTKGSAPENLSPAQKKRWKYQRFLKDYLRVVASMDDNIGRLLDYLDEAGLTENTVVVYTSDQGFFLGEHGWFDKRMMYEEPLTMPLVVRYPREIAPGSVCAQLAMNIDFAPTFLDYAGLEAPDCMQGKSLRTLLGGRSPQTWRDRVYYRYYQHPDAVNVLQHFGMRTERYKIIHYFVKAGDYGIFPEPAWELFDLEQDPTEMTNLYYQEAYAPLRDQLTKELFALQQAVGDTDDSMFRYSYHAYK